MEPFGLLDIRLIGWLPAGALACGSLVASYGYFGRMCKMQINGLKIICFTFMFSYAMVQDKVVQTTNLMVYDL